VESATVGGGGGGERRRDASREAFEKLQAALMRREIGL
jgi:hypothetical protein